MKLMKRILRIFRRNKKDSRFSEALSESFKEMFGEMGYDIDEAPGVEKTTPSGTAASITK
jgi:hypothetical protein